MLKKLLMLITGLLAVGIGLHFLPPAEVHSPVLPTIDKIEDYVTEQESKYEDITSGAEKIIIWANPKQTKTDYSIVYIHGYSATRQESAPLSDLLAKELGANVFHTRLAGHGRLDEKMVDGKLKLWKKDVLEALEIGKKIGDKIIVVSVSTGGTLSTWLTAREGTENIVAQLMISPNFDIPKQDAYLLDLPLGIGVLIAQQMAGKNHKWQAKNELQEKYWSTEYPIKAVRAMVQTLKEVKKINKQDITTPTLMIYSKKDTVVLTSAIVETFKEFGSNTKQLVEFDAQEDTHVLAGDIVSPKSVKPVLRIFLDFLYSNKIVQEPLIEPVSVITEIS